jgi:hypothetical protein
MQNPSARLGTIRQVNQPLLEPHSVEGASGNYSLAGSVIRPAEGAETILRLGSDVGIAGVQGETQPDHYQEGSEVRLIQNVHVSLRFEDNTKEPQPQRSCDSSPSRKPKISHPKPDHLLGLLSPFKPSFSASCQLERKKEPEAPARQISARRPFFAFRITTEVKFAG